MLRKELRLKKKTDIDHVFKKGGSLSGGFFRILIKENELNHHRFLVITSKKHGRAHQRNQIRRWIYPILREVILQNNQAGTDTQEKKPKFKDMIVLPRYELITIKKEVWKPDLLNLLKKI